MIYNLAIIDVMKAIEDALRGLLGQLCILVYNLIAPFYDLFLKLSQINILKGNDIVEQIYNRIGLILGIFMAFKLAFSLIQSLIDPNKLTDKKNGVTSIMMRSVISIVLLGITPALFNQAYKLQAILVGAESSSDNILYKLIFADTSKTSDDFGKELAVNFYFSFFKDENYPFLYNEIDNQNSISAHYGNTIEKISNNIIDSGSFSDTYPYLMMTVNDTFVIEFSPFLCLGAGILVLWMLITYSFQIAVRVFQLAYLQLIAPIPILSYISEPDGSFKTWLKQCSTTFLDLFLRLAIIYFVMYMVNALQGIFNNIGDSANSDGGSITIEIFLICGLLIFAKKVPDLLKELFPLSGGAASLGLGLKSPKNLFNDIPIVGGVANKALGYAGNLGKKAGKFAWNHTGGKINNNYNRWKDDRAGYKEGYKKDKESEKAWAEYGNDFNNKEYKRAFSSARDKNGEYAASYAELEKASNALKNYSGDTNSADYRKLIADKEKAQKNHDVNREKYKDLARREDQLKRYVNRHPEVRKNTSSTSSSATHNPYQGSNYKGVNQPINEKNSMFANMSDSEWQERQAQNNRDYYASQTDPNDYFDKFNQMYADEYVENNGVSDEFDKSWEAKKTAMEDAYRKAGWKQDDSGKWTKNGS